VEESMVMKQQPDQSSSLQDIWGFSCFLETLCKDGFYHEVTTTTKPVGPTVTYHDKEYINFASINVLNTHQEPDVMKHFLQAAKQYGLVTGGSRVTQGVSSAHKEMEEELTRITGKERSISFASGLLANIGFINAMTCKFDFSSTCGINNSDAVFVLDRDCHWSLWKAASHLEFGKQLFPFRHNDPKHLEILLKRLSKTHKKIVVVFESIYSADGSIAPMKELLDACEKYGAISYVDNANGFMFYGPEQRLFSEEFKQMNRATFVMVSFSKAVGMEGGAISGPKDMITMFELLSGTSLFTAAIQPPTASTITYILHKLEKHPEIMDQYLERSLKLRQVLEEKHFRLNDTPSYIISVIIGNDKKAVKVYEACLENNIMVGMFRYPAVKPGHALIRIMMNAGQTDEQLQCLIAFLEKMKDTYKF